MSSSQGLISLCQHAAVFVPVVQPQGLAQFTSVSVLPSLSLKNKQQQQSENKSWQSTSGYRQNYDQYTQYQQQTYPGFYSSWGYDQTGGMYGYNYPQYDYSQYSAAQVTAVSVKPAVQISVIVTQMGIILTSFFLFLGERNCSGGRRPGR